VLFGSILANTDANRQKSGVIRSMRAAWKLIRAGWRAPSISELDEWIELGAGNRSTSGMLVSQETANNFTAYFSGVFQIAQTIGSCPLHIYQMQDGKKIEWTGNALNTALSVQANPHMDAYRWKEVMQHHALSWGNGYSRIVRTPGNRTVMHLWPMRPDLTRVEVKENGEPEYVFDHPKRGEIRLQYDDVFHLAGFGFDGYQGYSLLSLHRDAIGLGLAQQEFQHRFLANGAHIPGFFEHPKELSDAAAKRLRENLSQAYAGLMNTGKSPVLEEGMTYKSINMPLKDAEFLASRTFQIQEIARILNIPTPKLKDYSKLTYSNAEQLAIEYRTDTIRPWAERWESAINSQLLTTAGRQKLGAYAEFSLNAISRGDMKTEYESFREGRYGGWLNADEVRQMLGMNPLDDEEVGRRYWQPVNMVDAADPEPKSGDSTGDQDEQVVQDPSED